MIGPRRLDLPIKFGIKINSPWFNVQIKLRKIKRATIQYPG